MCCSRAARGCSARGLWQGGDEAVIDGVLVNGSARAVGWCRRAWCGCSSPGCVYQYAFTMLIGGRDWQL